MKLNGAESKGGSSVDWRKYFIHLSKVYQSGVKTILNISTRAVCLSHLEVWVRSSVQVVIEGADGHQAWELQAATGVPHKPDQVHHWCRLHTMLAYKDRGGHTSRKAVENQSIIHGFRQSDKEWTTSVFPNFISVNTWQKMAFGISN